MKDIRYLNKDFSQFRNNLIEFAKNYFPTTYQDFNESSPAMSIIEMASYVGEVLSFYTDNTLKESILQHAGSRGNVLALAANIGYKQKNRIPAQCNLDIFQLLPATATKSPDWTYALTIREGMRIKSDTQEFRTVDLVNFAVSGSNNPTEVTVYQTNTIDNTPEYFLLKKTVKAVAGTIQTETFEFETAKRYEKILLNAQDIIEVISITDSDGNEWKEVPFLAQDTVFETITNTIHTDPTLSSYNATVPYLLKLRKTARRFITKFRGDQRLEIQFGAGISDTLDEELIPNPDNVGASFSGLQVQFDQPIDPSNFLYTKTYGLAPNNTTLTVKYTTGGGVASNVPAESLKSISNIQFDVDTSSLDSVLLRRIKSSVAATNPKPASGGKDIETIEEIRQNAIASSASQLRAVSAQDYIIRAYSMPAKFGAVTKAYVIQDTQLNVDDQNGSNPLAINLYTLGQDANGYLCELNPAIKENLRTYLSVYRMLTDAINIKTAWIINIGIKFEVVTLPEYNSNEVLLNCIKELQSQFDIKKWQINQPIVLSKLYTALDKVTGVQSVTKINIVNLHSLSDGYSGNVYDIAAATKNGVVYPSIDPSCFEIRYKNSDIVGKVNSL